MALLGLFWPFLGPFWAPLAHGPDPYFSITPCEPRSRLQMGVQMEAPKTEHWVQNRPFWGSFDPIQTTFSYGGPRIRTPRALRDPKSEDPELFGTSDLRTPSSSRPQISGSRALRDPESTHFDHTPSGFISLWLDLDEAHHAPKERGGVQRLTEDPRTLDMDPGTLDLVFTTIYLRARA